MALWDTNANTAEATVGTAHGKQSWARWDPSMAAVMFGAAALLFLVFVNFNFTASGSATIGK